MNARTCTLPHQMTGLLPVISVLSLSPFFQIRLCAAHICVMPALFSLRAQEAALVNFKLKPTLCEN